MTQRRVLDRESLGENGITFSTTVANLKKVQDVLGNEAKILAKQLLNFQRIAPQDRVKPLQTSEFRSLTRRVRAELTDRQQLKQLIVNGKLKQKAVKANKQALDIVAKTEERWMELVKETLFKEIKERARDTEGADMLSARDIKCWLRLEGNDIWKASQEVLARTTPSSAPMLTCPKPDLYLSLPIIERKRVVKRDRNRDYVYNFFLDELQIMENENGLVSCPLNALGEGDVDERYRLCFPGFVLEAKHHLVTQSNRIKAYCQAANASANALALLHNLITGSYANDPTDDDRPVVAMTLVGHKARLWLAGITSERKKLETFKTPGRRKTRRRYIRVKYHMQCVWKGDLHYEDEMTQLVCIIEELEQWMISDFRPFVSDRIALYEDADQWGALEDEETDTEESEGEGESNTDSDEQTDEDEDSDENWSPTGTDDESESGLDSDDEDLSEYERDIDRIDSLMDKLALEANAKVSHRFIRHGNDLGL